MFVDAPVFTMRPNSSVVGVIEGGEITLTCEVKADPIVLEHLHWHSKKSGKIDTNDTHYHCKQLRRHFSPIVFCYREISFCVVNFFQFYCNISTV